MPDAYNRYRNTFPDAPPMHRLSFKGLVDLGYWGEAERRLERVIARGRPVSDWAAFLFFVSEHYRYIAERKLFWGDENEGEESY